MVIGKQSAVIIDDEQRARININFAIDQYCPEIEIVRDFEKPEEALSFLLKNPIDIVFLDIDMPNMSGFELLQNLSDSSPKVIIVSASDKYGIEAVKAGAFDYLLKPLDIAELRKMMGRLHSLNDQSKVLDYEHNHTLTLPVVGGLKILESKDIVRIVSDNSYCDLFLSNADKLVVTKSIGDFEDSLAAKGFFRVHKKHLINLGHLDTLKLEGLSAALMKNGDEVPVSRRRLKDFKERMQKWFSNAH